MEWRDEAIILSVRPFGETDAILDLMTRHHGRHAGLVKGGAGRRQQGLLQPGNGVTATWRARLADQLGNFALEAGTHRAVHFMDEPLRLAALRAATALLAAALPEREPHAAAFEGLSALLDAAAETPPVELIAAYVVWELALLADLGFGLDLARCAVTGTHEDLTHVSPRTGRAVCRSAAAPYGERLLRLPVFLLGRQAGDPAPAEIIEGLALTAHFLERHVLWPQDKPLPPPRARLADGLAARCESARPKPPEEVLKPAP